ncbi:hypothetical protein PVK06_010423 [Gossypium arboreum]|uniref:Uncharacterized protein n=1 Tax=Gossypium arboreum TaxID=29729 RepID=A0ABR0Q681_GOSAR|nr:hypothetical protein PVK06_010423 [Gossypium arboreum]
MQLCLPAECSHNFQAILRSQLLFESPSTPKLLNSSSSLAEDASKMVSEVAAAACRLWSIER